MNCGGSAINDKWLSRKEAKFGGEVKVALVARKTVHGVAAN